jgi:hypothetical protein
MWRFNFSLGKTTKRKGKSGNWRDMVQIFNVEADIISKKSKQIFPIKVGKMI